MIKNVILDMGNTLLLFSPDVSVNKYCSSDEEKSCVRRALFEGEEWILADAGKISDKDKFDKVKHKVPEKYHAALKNCAENFDICFKPLDGANEFCDYIKNKGYGIYILSNASDKFYEYFQRWKKLDYFTGYVVSCDIHMLKPSEEIYKYLLNKYKLKAEECLFIDDIEKNIEGAKKVGMKAEIFKHNYDEIIKKYNL